MTDKVILGSAVVPLRNVNSTKGTFTESLTVGGTAVSLNGHTHNMLHATDGTLLAKGIVDSGVYYFRPDPGVKGNIHLGSGNNPWTRVHTEDIYLNHAAKIAYDTEEEAIVISFG